MADAQTPTAAALDGAVLSRTDTLVGAGEDIEKGSTREPSSPREGSYGPAKSEHVIPEGGWKAWSTVAGAWLTMVATFGYVYAHPMVATFGYMSSFGIFETLYVEGLLTNYSTSDIGWIGGVQIFLMFGVGVVAGKVFDAQHFRIPMAVASVVHVGCTFALSACEPGKYYQFFLAQGLGQGLAMGMMYLPSLAIVSHYFEKKRALMMGIVLTGSSIGAIVIPVLLTNVLVSQGYVWGVRICGFFLLGLLIPANLLMHPNFNPEHQEMPKVTIVGLLSEKVYLVGLAAAFFTNIGLFFPNAFLQLFAVAHGMDQSLAFYTGAILNAASILGRVAPNYLADRWGPVTCQIPSQFICVILIFALFGIASQGSIIAFSVLYGVASGAVYSLFAPMLATMASSMAEVGIRLGFASIVLGIAGLIGNPMTGALIGNGPIEFAWWKAIVFNGIILMTGASLMIPLRYLLQQKRQKVWV